ncbi:rRNA pseudouridine synthase [Candidatus Woesearchaeota archaeon]|nr:rRNA pseudouridine synthase [Candidatus Woesearchaeota archaeon]
MHRVQKLLSNYGYCSRRKAEELIKEGRVKVNSEVISIGDKAKETDKIYVDNELVSKQKKVYLMLNKPLGCVTAVKDPVFDTVMDYVKTKERIFPIGRLDYNTSGLLLFTNDGDFANRIMHPRYEIRKTYLAGLRNKIDDKQIKKIETGVMLEDGKTSPANVKKHGPNLIEITIHEGKNKIIRRILKKLDLKVRFLKRIRVGKLELKDLKEGKYRFLTEQDIKKVFA